MWKAKNVLNQTQPKNYLLHSFLALGFIFLSATAAFSAPSINNSSPACPFPRNVKYSFGMQPNNMSLAAMNAAVSNFYVVWYNNFVTGSGANTRVMGGVSTTGTVSEGIGYGMLIAALMGDKPLLDGLYGFYSANLDGNGLMNWTCTGGTGTCSGNAATDADQDVCMALYFAATQWGGTYAANAATVAGHLIGTNCFAGNRVTGGDNNSGFVYPDYCAPGWYRCFATKTGNANWTTIANWVYSPLFVNLNAQWPYGYVPNEVNNDGTFKTAVAISPETALNHGYDASRMGWRMGMDYLWNGTNQAPISLYAHSIYNGSNTSGFINYIQEYWNVTNGQVTGKTGPGVGSPCSPLQIGPAVIGSMAGLPNNAQNQDFVNAIFSELISRTTPPLTCPGYVYFEDTLSMMCLLATTGNFPNLACGSCTSAPVANTPTPYPCFLVDDLEDANLQNNTNGFWFTFSYNSVNNTPVPAPGQANSKVSAVTYLVDGTATGTGSVGGSLYSARVTGTWQDNGHGAPATYGGFAMATELQLGYQNLTNGAGPISLTQISFDIKCSKATKIRLNFYNPTFDPINGANNCGVWANQYGYTFPVSTSWQRITINRYQINCQDWGGTGNCSVTCSGVTYNRDLALSKVTSLQWLSVGDGDTISYWVDNVCLAFNRGAVVPSTATPIPTATMTPGAATNTATKTPTNTPTNTVANTATRTATPTPSNTVANTATRTPTSTPSNSPTNTATRTATNTPTNSSTNTVGSTSTNTPTKTSTNTPTNSLTNTPSRTPSPTNTTGNTATNSPTRTASNTPTPTPAITNTATNSPTNSPTRTVTNTPTPTPAISNTATNSPTVTPTRTATNSPTNTASPTLTNTATRTATSTSTNTVGNTLTPSSTATATPTRTASNTPTNSSTSTSTNSATATLTRTATNTPTNSLTNSPTRTPSSTATLSPTPTISNTPTDTATGTLQPSDTATLSPTNTASNTASRTPTSTLTSTPTATSTRTATNTATASPTNTNPNTPTRTGTPTATNSPGINTATNTPSNTPSNSATRTATNSPTNSPTVSSTPTNTPAITNTATRTPTRTATNTATVTPTATTVTVVVTNGPSMPPSANSNPGAVDVPVLQFQLTNPGSGSANINNLTLTAAGSGNDLTGIASVNVYLDNNNDGVFDAGDTPLANGTFSADNGTVVINLGDSIPPGGTNTYLVTYTFSSTAAAGNYSTSFNPSVNLTGTNASGAILFSGAAQNSAQINLAASTLTPTATLANTPTATPETVTVASGPVVPSSSTKLPGTIGVPVLEIQALNLGAASASVTHLRLTASGSGNDNSGISSVALYLDTNGNGMVDPSEILLATGSYAADDGQVTLNLSNTIPPGSAANYLVVYNFSAGAPTGTYSAALLPGADIQGTNLITAKPVLFTGALVNGATITLVNGTPTVTFTPTITPTITATITPTGVTVGSTPVVFPNPADGTAPVSVAVNLQQATDSVSVQIFTVAFRKVQETTYSSASSDVTATLISGNLARKWILPVLLKDKWGTNLASGLYYVVIATPNGRSVGKLLIER